MMEYPQLPFLVSKRD